MTLDEKRNFLLDYDICGEEVIDTVTALMGYNDETFSDLLYYYTGYRTFEDAME